MFILGHLGIGSKLASPWARRLPRVPFWIGTLAPDVVDKLLYYSMSWSTGKHGADLGLISGTRTIGHTGLLLIGLGALAAIRRSKLLAALTLGVATHLLLDSVGDRVTRAEESSAFLALTFPLNGWRFGVAPFEGLGEHAHTLLSPHIIWGETIGLACLLWEYWKDKNQSAILAAARSLGYVKSRVKIRKFRRPRHKE